MDIVLGVFEKRLDVCCLRSSKPDIVKAVNKNISPKGNLLGAGFFSLLWMIVLNFFISS